MMNSRNDPAVATKRPDTEASPWRQAAGQFFASKVATVATVALTFIVVLACAAPWIAPQNPYDLASLDLLDARLAPLTHASAQSLTYWLGTDGQGRDMLSAILYGLRISVGVGFAATVLALLIGMTLGLAAGYAGGFTDQIVMRVVELQLSFPAILLALVLIVFLRPGLGNIVIALVAAQWAYYARTARAVALVERERQYIEAARGLGLSSARVVYRHLLPNCLPALMIVSALQVASAISLEATLSFLGLGVPITEPSLGLLIANGFQYLLSGSYWISLFPGIALVVVVVAINLVADRLRDILDPKALNAR